MRYYEALGLTPSLTVDAADLKQRFYDRSRQWHPDRFSRATAEDQAKSLEMTSILNDAFRTLRDPVARAEYFLKENGLEVSKEAPVELLEEVFELNMVLEELREGDESARGQLLEAQTKFDSMLSAADKELTGLFAHYDTAPSPKTLDEIRGTLNRRRYISNLVRDVEKELNVHSAN
ncbi:MAG: Fe-S protein assembly co-chaperone HscB [Acidobacteriota bacterium]